MLLAAAALVLLAHPSAVSSDVLSNVGPASQLPSGSLTDAYPLGNYQLDHHFDAVEAGVFSGVDVSGIAPTIAWFLAQMTWLITSFLAQALITVFTFAFSLDLVNGSAATGGAGALAPVSDAVQAVYRDVFGAPWLVVAILLAGMWAMWNALVRRRFVETAGALSVSLLFIVIALAFVARPEIIGHASRWTNQMSGAFLALSTQGTIGDAEAAKKADADQLFAVLVYDPWVVLNFGGLEHCVRADDHAVSVPVRPLSRDPARDAQLSRRLAAGTQVQADGKVCVNNRAKYAPHFLRFAPDTDERNAEYDALKNGDAGKLPDADPGKADGSYRLSAIDKPAAEAMGKGGQYQRLLLAVVIFVGELGAFLLLGAAAVAVILAQVLVLLLLAFAPVALVLGVFPGRGHEFFVGWLGRLATFLVLKAIYSLILAVLLAVAGALQDATANLGWLMSWGFQAVFFWTVFLNRRQLIGMATRATAGGGTEPRVRVGRLAAAYGAVRMLTRPHPTPPRPPRPPKDERSTDSSADAPPPPPVEAGAPGTASTLAADGASPSPSRNGAPPSRAPGRGAASTPIDGRDGTRTIPVAVSDGHAGTATPASRSTEAVAGASAEAAEAPAAADAQATAHDASASAQGPRAGARGGNPPHGGAGPADRRGGAPSAESPLRRSLHDDAQRLGHERAASLAEQPASGRGSPPERDATPSGRTPPERPSSAPSRADAPPAAPPLLRSEDDAS